MDYTSMTRQELESMLIRLESDLEDLEEMTSFHFANTSAHINASEIKREEDRLKRIRDSIATVQTLLAEA